MKICHICSGFPPAVGGTETHNYSIVKYLSEKGYDVDVIVIRPSRKLLLRTNYDENTIKKILTKKFTMPELKNVRLYNIPYPKPIIGYYQIWKKVREIEKKHGKIDVIDVHTYPFAIPFSKKRKIILSLHFFELTCPHTIWPKPCNSSLKNCSKCVGYFRYFYWKVTKNLALNKISKIMVKYNYAKNILVKSGLDKNKIEVIPHWIDVEKIRTNKIEKKSDDNFIFTFIGRLSEEKGPDLLLKAFSKIPNKTKKLVFIGSGALKGELINFCKNNKIENVEFRGYVPHNQIGRYLNESDCIVFPHRYFNYEWALLEAMCVEKPIIATDVEATSEILTDGFNAILCEPNEKSIEGALKRVLECKDLKEIAKNSYSIVKEKHSMKNLEKYEEMIHSL